MGTSPCPARSLSPHAPRLPNRAMSRSYRHCRPLSRLPKLLLLILPSSRVLVRRRSHEKGANRYRSEASNPPTTAKPTGSTLADEPSSLHHYMHSTSCNVFTVPV